MSPATATALLVIDMQNTFLSMVTTSLPKTLQLISHFRSPSLSPALPIIFTQHGHTEEELAGETRNQLVRKWGPDGSIAIGSEGWEFIPEISKHVRENREENGIPVVAKNTYDAFLNTNLQGILDEKGIERVVVCGVMTDCCCDTTARSAFNRGFETWLAGDACGTSTKGQQERAVRGFEFAFGEVLETEEVLERLGK